MEKDQVQSQITGQSTGHLILPAADQNKSDLALLVQAFCRHPFLLWGSLWTLLFIVVNITLSNFLLNPEFVAQSEQIQEPPAVEAPDTPIPASAESKDSLPLWSFGAIAFSCAIASLMVSQRLRQPPRPPKPTKRSSSTSPRTTPGSQIASQKIASQGKAIAPSPRSKLAVQSQPTVVQLTAEELPVSVVPTNESHPLDWGEASLADSLDIRYRRPLSSWR